MNTPPLSDPTSRWAFEELRTLEIKNRLLEERIAALEKALSELLANSSA